MTMLILFNGDNKLLFHFPFWVLCSDSPPVFSVMRGKEVQLRECFLLMLVQDVLQPQRPVPPQPALIPADGVQRLHHMVENDFDEDVPTSGHFMAYFVTAVVLCVAGYVIYHNKQKVGGGVTVRRENIY